MLRAHGHNNQGTAHAPMGILYFCTGVGLEYLVMVKLRATAAPSTSGSNTVTGSGTSSPDTSTGMSSYCGREGHKRGARETKPLTWTARQGKHKDERVRTHLVEVDAGGLSGLEQFALHDRVLVHAAVEADLVLAGTEATATAIATTAVAAAAVATAAATTLESSGGRARAAVAEGAATAGRRTAVAKGRTGGKATAAAIAEEAGATAHGVGRRAVSIGTRRECLWSRGGTLRRRRESAGNEGPGHGGASWERGRRCTAISAHVGRHVTTCARCEERA